MTDQPKSRARRPRAMPDETIAQILAEAESETDAVVAKRYKVRRGNIVAWRRQATKDVVLGAMVDERRLAVLSDWRIEVAMTAIACNREVRRVLATGGEIPFSLIAAVKVYGAQCIEAEAMLAPLEARSTKIVHTGTDTQH